MARATDEGKREAARLLAGQHPRPTTREIAGQLGVNPRTVQRWLGEGNQPRGPRPNPAVSNERIIEMRDTEGLSWQEIATQTALSHWSSARSRYWAAKGIQRPDRRKDA